MITLVRTNADDEAFRYLVSLLDEGLKITDGEEHAFYDQFNKVDNIKYVVVAYDDEIPVGCGAIKEYDVRTMEIKRMFVKSEQRGKGIASTILADLESWAMELNHNRCILETGSRQVEAIDLYHKRGYKRIQNYGQYAGIENSVCFDKDL